MIVRLKEKTFEHYGKQKFDLSKYDWECDEDTFNKNNIIAIKFADINTKPLPKGWINQGNRLGYDPFGYVVTKDSLEIINGGK